MDAAIARSVDTTSPLRKALLVAAALIGISFVLRLVAMFISDRDGSDWFALGSSGLSLVLIGSFGPLQRRQAVLVRRSVERNRALIDG
jgi:hypothetical protein